MRTALKDGTILDLRHVSKRWGEVIFRARWLAPAKAWIDWDRQHVQLSKHSLKGWRISDQQFRLWTEEEVAQLANLHDLRIITYIDPKAAERGERVVVGQNYRH